MIYLIKWRWRLTGIIAQRADAALFSEKWFRLRIFCVGQMILPLDFDNGSGFKDWQLNVLCFTQNAA